MTRLVTRITLLLLVVCLISLPALGQFPDKTGSGDLLRDAIDFHVHTSPDIFDRSLNDFELAEMCLRRGMRAVVVKNHVSSTADRAELTNLHIGRGLVYGGIVLNRAVGGINPQAVEAMPRMSERYGKVVWFPTMDAAHHVQVFGLKKQGLSIMDGNQLSKATKLILTDIVANELVLATGHLSPTETMTLVKAAKVVGVQHIVVTHALADSPGLTIDQMKELAGLGAILELTYLSYLSGPQSHLAFLKASKYVPLKQMADAIKTIGAEHFLMSSDLGQSGNATPPDGLKLFAELLMQQGVSLREVELMLKANPARLLGLPYPVK